MIYIGMDVSSKEFMIHAIDEKKKIKFKGGIEPTRRGLRKMIKELGKESKLVVFEAGNQLKWVALTLKAIEGVEVHIVEGKVRQLRELISARHRLQSKRVALINSIRGFMKQEGYRLPVKFFKSVNWRERLAHMRVGETQKVIIESYMKGIEGLQTAEGELTEKIKAINDKKIELLESIPSLGEISSRVIVGAIGDVERFESKKAVAKYGALTPRIYQSGGVTHLGRINQDGRMEVRRVLLQCSHTITRMKSYAARPLKEFYERIAKRRGKKVAIVALARKLLVVAYGVLKTKTMYNPAMLASSYS
jgi:transposase